jgi:hypothetical protein
MFWLLVLLVAFFLLAMLLRAVFPALCAICFAVFGTWLVGILLHVSGQTSVHIDAYMLALLMGGSAVGFMYYLASTVPERYQLFKLPYLLTAFTVLYFVLQAQADLRVLVLLGVVWAGFGLVFLARHQHGKRLFHTLIACCRDW